MKKNILFPLLGAFIITSIAGGITLSKEARAGDKAASVSCSPSLSSYVTDTVPKKKKMKDKKKGMGQDSTRRWNHGKDSLPGGRKHDGRTHPDTTMRPM